MHDVIIIGGSYAGLSAALQLGRARRDVLVVDAGERRNRFASHAHGLLGRDGRAPADIVAEGREDLKKYSTVTIRDGHATGVRRSEHGFVVAVGAEDVEARRLVLATGVVDTLPRISGVEERWGKSIFACPYCHGYELDRGRLGVLATNAMSAHYALLVSEWAAPGQTTYFLNGGDDPTDEELTAFEARKIRIERSRVAGVQGEAPKIDVDLGGRARVSLDGLFLASRADVAGPFAKQLGLELEQGPVGTFYRTGPFKETSVPGVFACGDAGIVTPAVTFALADGALAGVGVHQSLVFTP